MPSYRYKGLDRRGVARVGAATADNPAALTERLFNAGWRELVVFSDDEQVGWIWRHLDTGRRTWSGDASP